MATIADVRPRPSRDFMSVREAAEWYAISKATLWRLLQEAQLHRHRRPRDRRTYLSVEELEKLLRPRA
jgi:predicted DNA-binding transcriptional regulator AlpA